MPVKIFQLAISLGESIEDDGCFLGSFELKSSSRSSVEFFSASEVGFSGSSFVISKSSIFSLFFSK